MSKFEKVDYSKLDQKINKTYFKLSKKEVQDQLIVIGFDIVRFRDDDQDSKLWQIQSADDGDYIIALYDEDQVKTASLHWQAKANKSSLDVYYKGEPIVRLASSQLGIPDSELAMTAKYLPSKLQENKKLACSLLKEVSDIVKREILSKYPELNDQQ